MFFVWLNNFLYHNLYGKLQNVIIVVFSQNNTRSAKFWEINSSKFQCCTKCLVSLCWDVLIEITKILHKMYQFYGLKNNWMMCGETRRRIVHMLLLCVCLVNVCVWERERRSGVLDCQILFTIYWICDRHGAPGTPTCRCRDANQLQITVSGIDFLSLSLMKSQKHKLNFSKLELTISVVSHYTANTKLEWLPCFPSLFW